MSDGFQMRSEGEFQRDRISGLRVHDGLFPELPERPRLFPGEGVMEPRLHPVDDSFVRFVLDDWDQEHSGRG